MIEKERFDVIVDENGEFLTDWDLLIKLKENRDLIAFRDHIPSYAVARSNWLVLLATYKPKNEEECSSIRGLIPSFYLKYGKELIELINQP